MLNPCNEIMTSCRPRLEKAAILERKKKIAVKPCIQSLVIRGNDLSFLTK